MATILIADDDPHQLSLRALLLERSGHTVQTALSPNGVRTMVECGVPDVLLMDLSFPNARGEADPEEGYALIRDVQAGAPGLPVIVLSGWPHELETRPELRAVARVLVKPCRLEVMLEAIEACTRPAISACAPVRNPLSA